MIERVCVHARVQNFNRPPCPPQGAWLNSVSCVGESPASLPVPLGLARVCVSLAGGQLVAHF